MMAASGYNAATNGRRMLNVGSTTRGVNSLALSDGPMLTARARKAFMENPLVATGVAAYRSEVIGTGIRPHFLHEDPDTRKLLARKFERWTLEASATRRVGLNGKADSLRDFYADQGLICDNIMVAGEAFARLRPRLEADGMEVPLQIEMIEPEQLPFWKTDGGLGSNLVRGGIEFDAIGRRVAYHFYRQHPGDATVWPNAWDISRVPSPAVLHMLEFQRGNQIRGITGLAPILIALADIHDYDDGVRFKNKLGSYLFAWKESLTPDDPQANGTQVAGADTAPEGAQFVDIQKGELNVMDTAAGEKFNFYTPPDVGTMYETFMRVQREPIAAVLRISYEMLTGNMSGVNYSSARVRLMNLRRMWRQFQYNVIVHQFCRPVAWAWLEQAALAGVIDVKDYLARPEEYRRIAWRPERWEYVNPKDDIDAERAELEAAVDSAAGKIAERGEDIEDVYADIQRSNQLAEKYGVRPVYGKSGSVQQNNNNGQQEDR